MSEWISVEDRLPKNNRNISGHDVAVVLVSDGDNVISSVFAEGFGWIDFPDMKGDITHWQPLPEPPK